MRKLLAILLVGLPLTVSAQGDRLPDYNPLKVLGDAYEKACVGAGHEYKKGDNHQLAPGGQWYCTGWPFNIRGRVSNG